MSFNVRLGIAGVIIIAISMSSGFVVLQVNQIVTPDTVFVPYFLTIPNPSNVNETMYLSINLESKGSIAAQKDVTAYILLAPNHAMRSGNNGIGYSDLPPYFLIVFGGTACPEKDSDKYGSQFACGITLTKQPVKAIDTNPQGVNYQGTGTIKFATGGLFGVWLGTNFDESSGTADAISSDGAFINIVSLEDAQQVELTRATLYLAIPLAVIGAAISLVPIIVGRK